MDCRGWRTPVGLMLALMVVLPSTGASQDLPAVPGARPWRRPLSRGPQRDSRVGVERHKAAQPAGEHRERWAFAFMSPGFTNDPKKVAIWHIGGGYEWLVARTFALSAGAGAMVAGVEGFDCTITKLVLVSVARPVKMTTRMRLVIIRRGQLGLFRQMEQRTKNIIVITTTPAALFEEAPRLQG